MIRLYNITKRFYADKGQVAYRSTLSYYVLFRSMLLHRKLRAADGRESEIDKFILPRKTYLAGKQSAQEKYLRIRGHVGTKSPKPTLDRWIFRRTKSLSTGVLSSHNSAYPTHPYHRYGTPDGLLPSQHISPRSYPFPIRCDRSEYR